MNIQIQTKLIVYKVGRASVGPVLPMKIYEFFVVIRA